MTFQNVALKGPIVLKKSHILHIIFFCIDMSQYWLVVSNLGCIYILFSILNSTWSEDAFRTIWSWLLKLLSMQKRKFNLYCVHVFILFITLKCSAQIYILIKFFHFYESEQNYRIDYISLCTWRHFI